MGIFVLVWGFYQLEIMIQVAIVDVVIYVFRGIMIIKVVNGVIFQEIGNVSYDKVIMGEILFLVEQVFVVSEDSCFWEYWGIDFQGIMWVFLFNV